jgi:hypothetical protein
MARREIQREAKGGEASKYTCKEFKRDFVPLPQTFPLPLGKGKGDKGG